MQRFKFLAILALAFLASPVMAEPGAIQQVQTAGGVVEFERLFEAVGEPGESPDALALRVAPRLRAYSDATGFEACGVLATDGARFGVVVGSTRSHAACGSFLEAVPAGMEATAETIHSHRTGGVYRANENDAALMGGRVGQRFKSASPDEFSREDFHAPGYLVGARGVWHQAGRRTARQVGSL